MAAREGEELVAVSGQRNHDARRQVWHERLGSKDRKGCEELVNVDFGFKEEANHG